MTAVKKPEPKHRFRLLAGCHIEEGPRQPSSYVRFICRVCKTECGMMACGEGLPKPQPKADSKCPRCSAGADLIMTVETGERTDVVFRAGDIIETDRDLGAMFNVRGMPPKFEKLDDRKTADLGRQPNESIEEYAARLNALIADAKAEEASKQSSRAQQPTSAQLPNFDSMTAKQLVEYAEAEEIDTRGMTKKEDLVKVIRAALIPA